MIGRDLGIEEEEMTLSSEQACTKRKDNEEEKDLGTRANGMEKPRLPWAEGDSRAPGHRLDELTNAVEGGTKSSSVYSPMDCRPGGVD